MTFRIERDANGLPVRLWLDGRRIQAPAPQTHCQRCACRPALQAGRCWTCWRDYSSRPYEQTGVIG